MCLCVGGGGWGEEKKKASSFEGEGKLYSLSNIIKLLNMLEKGLKLLITIGHNISNDKFCKTEGGKL